MESKKLFVEGTLSETMSEGFSYINRLEFAVDNFDEWVAIVCNNGYRYWVCVTGDSLSGIVVDVVKEANKH